MVAKKSLESLLKKGPVICAEGYLFELERRGYLQAGAFVPEVVLEYPEVVEQLHREFVRAGSDVVEAFTYYAHRDKLRVVGRENDLEKMNRTALRIAKKVADETGTLMAGNICNTNIFLPNDPVQADKVRAIFREQVEWAKEEGADFIIAETINFYQEASIALEEIQRVGLPAVVMLVIGKRGKTWDGLTPVEACTRLANEGALVVGFNCYRGPHETLALAKKVKRAVSCYVAALPVPYRTSKKEPIFQMLTDKAHSKSKRYRPFPLNLEPCLCNRDEVTAFGKAVHDADIRFVGLCCGNAPHFTRALAEALGRKPEASKYSPDLSKHSLFGKDKKLEKAYFAYAKDLSHGK